MIETKLLHIIKIHFTPVNISKAGLRQADKQLAALNRGGQKLQERDDLLLEYLRKVGMLSLEQIQRLLWPAGELETVRRRMTKLVKYGLLAYARRQGVGLSEWNLTARNIYTLGLVGRLLNEPVAAITPAVAQRHTIKEWVERDVVWAELFTRLTEAAAWRGAAWNCAWTGPEVEPVPRPLTPAALAVLWQDEEARLAAFIHLYLGAEKTINGLNWQPLVAHYDILCQTAWVERPDLAGLKQFPAVLIILQDDDPRRVEGVARMIKHYRRQPVTYLLAPWRNVLETSDLCQLLVWNIDAPPGEEQSLTDIPVALPPLLEHYAWRFHSRLERAGRQQGLPTLTTLANLELVGWDNVRWPYRQLKWVGRWNGIPSLATMANLAGVNRGYIRQCTPIRTKRIK